MTTFSPTPKKCDICTHPFRKSPGVLMYDAVAYGRWGCLCHECFTKFGCTLGVGHGQKYQRQTDGQFLLVEGGRHAV